MNNNQWAGIVDLSMGNYNKIYGNYFYSCGSDKYHHNIYINSQWGTCSYIDIGWNEFDHSVNSDHYGGIIDMRTASGTPYSNHIYVHDNYFHDGDDDAIYVSDEGGKINNFYAYNNVISNMTNTGAALVLIQQDANSGIYNNTFYYAAGASGNFFAIGSGTVCPFKNNIIYPRTGQTLLELVGTYNSDYDLYYNVSVPSGATHAVTGDPKFVTNGSDFHLQSSSPAKDAGISAVSSIVKKDYDGISRPQNSVYDIGAFEYRLSTLDRTPSSPPIGLRIVN